MKIIKTHEITPNDLVAQEKDWVYNGLDCCITAEVLAAIHPQLDPLTDRTYRFSLALQGPALEMRVRGVLVDEEKKNEVIDEYYSRIDRLEQGLNRLAWEGLGIPDFNWRSPKSLQTMFYDILEIPPVKRGGRPTVDRKALERLRGYNLACPLVNHILEMRDLGKKISVLKTEIDPDGRVRTSYNIAGTNTGRFSSSFSEFGTGGNLQNVEEGLRSIFIADAGFKFAKFDAKSGESYCVGGIEWNLFQDGRFLDAVESGDVHTGVARLCFPRLPWTGVLDEDRRIAEQPYYRGHSYRFMCKKIGHGSNYNGQPPRLAEEAEVPISVVTEFQPKYFAAFPGHRRWHAWVENEIRRRGYLISLTGRKRWFLGRRNDPATIREAIAFDPQGSLADIVNRAMLRIWRATKGAPGTPMGQVVVAMHDHDALTFQYPEHLEAEIISILNELLLEPIPLSHSRIMTIPYDCKTGWNKGEYNALTNPDGLKDWTGEDTRLRTPEVGIMDRLVYKKHSASRK